MPFELQPTLRGALLELRPLRADDFEALYAVASDPLIWEQHPESNRHERPVFEAFFRGAMESGGAFLVVDARDGAVIGSTRFHHHDEARSEIEIGWTFLARSRWGGRHNGEMKRLMLEHAFRFVERVVFLVGPRNVRSQTAVERIGGVRIGTRPDSRGGESVCFEITADRFRESQATR
jgi:RimJ/RimL family protein N-acetyltransferase